MEATMSTPAPTFDHLSPRQRLALLFGISVLGLFVELMLIRWIGTEIRIFAYLQNTVLVVCFLGLGMGCWSANQPARIGQSVFAFFVICLLLAVPTIRQFLGRITNMLAYLSDFVIWESIEEGSVPWRIGQILLGLLLTFGIMVVIWNIFLPLGRVLARLMNDHPNTIAAYSVNIFGSLVGILLFALASVLSWPPYVWCAIAALLYVPFLNHRLLANGGLLVATIGLGMLSTIYPDTVPKLESDSLPTVSRTVEVTWSPYQKLHLKEASVAHPQGTYRFFDLEVNNSSYQTLHDCRPEHYQQYPWRFPELLRGYTQYDLPLRLKPRPARCLVVGAGNGNDVAGALRHGAREVVAVEIDPVIIELGKRYHPERPYDDPRVVVVNDDARAYFANCRESFDLIIFGLLDSHTTTAMTNARLDHYVYTRESIEQAKKLLAPDGVMVLSFFVERPFIGDRMATLLREAFGSQPLAFTFPPTHFGRGGDTFITGDLAAIEAALAADPKLAQLIRHWQTERPLKLDQGTRPATDDWPYLYLERPSIPLIFVLLAGLMLFLYRYGLWQMADPNLLQGWNQRHWHFFFLGAAFMLLEVQNISKAAVVLGNTWDVNAVMIAGILLLILVANLIAQRFPRLPLIPVYALLIGSCVALYFVDLAQFAALPYLARAATVGLLASLPLLFSGIVFIRSFAVVPGKDAALGANLLGSLVGGLLQTLTFLLGIKALLLLVAGLYAIAFLTRPRAAASEALAGVSAAT